MLQQNSHCSQNLPVVDDKVLVPANRTGAARGDSILADASLSGGERRTAALNL